MATLGSFLKESRESMELKLRVVEDLIGISNAYLSQLENGKIENPSPVVLHKLANCYGISYAKLMELAGYPVPDEAFATPRRRQGGQGRTPFNNLTKDEEKKLNEYLLFLRSRTPKK